MVLRRPADACTTSFPIHNVKQRSLLRSRRALLRPGSFSSLSLLFVGWVERQQHPSPALPRAPGSMGFAHSAQPILRNSYLPFLRSRDLRARVLPSFSASDPRPRGWRSAGRRYPYSVAPVTTRHHVCEAWAVPRNRDDASRRSTVTVLGPVPVLRLRSCLRLPQSGDPRAGCLRPVSQGSRTSRARFTSRGRDATPAPPSGSSPETPLDERDFGYIAQAPDAVNPIM
jgi:hypothetical protein